LGNVGTKKVKQKFKLAETQTAYELGILGKKAAEQKLEWTVWITAISLGNVGTNAAEQKIEKATNIAKNGLIVILKIVEENEWKDIAQTITDELEKIKQIRDKSNNIEED
jgi:hypothetical protein